MHHNRIGVPSNPHKPASNRRDPADQIRYSKPECNSGHHSKIRNKGGIGKPGYPYCTEGKPPAAYCSQKLDSHYNKKVPAITDFIYPVL